MQSAFFAMFKGKTNSFEIRQRHNDACLCLHLSGDGIHKTEY